MSNLEEVYGPSMPAEHESGSRVRFLREGRECYGELLHVRRAGPAMAGGRVHPTLYIVDVGEGWPIHVPASAILEAN